MIASLNGILASQSGTQVVIEVNGVGYLVTAHPDTTAGISSGDKISVHTYQIVREDSLALFAFADNQTRDLFIKLQSVTGIGPKLAFTMLTTYENSTLCTAIVSKDEATLKRIPGLGAKSAARVCLELSDKLAVDANSNHTNISIVDALVGLGWSLKIATATVEQALTISPELKTDEPALLRACLSILGRS